MDCSRGRVSPANIALTKGPAGSLLATTSNPDEPASRVEIEIGGPSSRWRQHSNFRIPSEVRLSAGASTTPKTGNPPSTQATLTVNPLSLYRAAGEIPKEKSSNSVER
jgi:hypothetical protein